MFYRILSCFNVFYCFLSTEMPENGQKLPETVENDYESVWKSTKVHESSQKPTFASNGAEKSKFGEVYCLSKKS